LDDNNVFIDERGVTRIKIVENCRENLVMCDIDVGLFIIVVEICLRQIKPLKRDFDGILRKFCIVYWNCKPQWKSIQI